MTNSAPPPVPGVSTADRAPPVTPEAFAFARSATLEHLAREAAWNELVASRGAAEGPQGFGALARAFRHLIGVVERITGPTSPPAPEAADAVADLLTARIAKLQPQPGEVLTLTVPGVLPERAVTALQRMMDTAVLNGARVVVVEEGGRLEAAAPLPLHPREVQTLHRPGGIEYMAWGIHAPAAFRAACRERHGVEVGPVAYVRYVASPYGVHEVEPGDPNATVASAAGGQAQSAGAAS